MNYYNEINNKLIDNEIYERTKDYSKERHIVQTYFEIGKILNEAGGKYGDKIIEEYSKKLVIEVGKKYNDRTLRSMRQLYIMFNDEIWKPMVSKLSWTTFLVLMPLNDINKMYYYANQCLINNLSKRQLQHIIKSNEYIYIKIFIGIMCIPLLVKITNFIFTFGKKVNRDLIPLVEEAYKSESFSVEALTRNFIYPSDQINFHNGVGVASLKKSKRGILYMNRIHTKRDTVYTEENIEFLVNGSIKLTEKI